MLINIVNKSFFSHIFHKVTYHYQSGILSILYCVHILYVSMVHIFSEQMPLKTTVYVVNSKDSKVYNRVL